MSAWPSISSCSGWSLVLRTIGWVSVISEWVRCNLNRRKNLVNSNPMNFIFLGIIILVAILSGWIKTPLFCMFRKSTFNIELASPLCLYLPTEIYNLHTNLYGTWNLFSEKRLSRLGGLFQIYESATWNNAEFPTFLNLSYVVSFIMIS